MNLLIFKGFDSFVSEYPTLTNKKCVPRTMKEYNVQYFSTLLFPNNNKDINATIQIPLKKFIRYAVFF